MTSKIGSDLRISELEDRIHRLEKIILDNEDIFHPNFDGYEILTPEEEMVVDEALKDLENSKTIDDVLRNLE